MNKKLILIITILCITGCSFENNEGNHSDELMDLNSDGKKDVFYEYEKSGYYELVDRNFDGRIDESHRYDEKNKLISSKVDADFDGYLETRIIYKYESMEKMAIDIDRDNLYEIFYFYKSGTLENAIKYYPDDAGNKIGKISFKYGYPESPEVIEVTDMNKIAFQKLGDLDN